MSLATAKGSTEFVEICAVAGLKALKHRAEVALRGE